jgi:uncharacterized RDD family membrane protein YckC
VEERLITRRDMAGWVGGTERRGQLGRWPGDRLGLAKEGPTSMAGWGRRVLALVIDWFIPALVSTVWFQGNSLVTLGLFFVMQVLSVGVLGTTIGKRIVRIQVVRVGGAMTGLPKALLRTVLLCLLVPPLVIDGDGRGLHDRVAGTVQIRM